MSVWRRHSLEANMSEIYIFCHTHTTWREKFSRILSPLNSPEFIVRNFPSLLSTFAWNMNFKIVWIKKNEIVINSQKKSVWWENEYQLVAHDDDDDRERSRRVWKVAQEMIETFYRAVCCVRDQDEIWSGRDGLKWKCSTRLISLLLLREEYGWNDINFFFVCVISPIVDVTICVHWVLYAQEKKLCFSFPKRLCDSSEPGNSRLTCKVSVNFLGEIFQPLPECEIGWKIPNIVRAVCDKSVKLSRTYLFCTQNSKTPVFHMLSSERVRLLLFEFNFCMIKSNLRLGRKFKKLLSNSASRRDSFNCSRSHRHELEACMEGARVVADKWKFSMQSCLSSPHIHSLSITCANSISLTFNTDFASSCER